MTKFRGEKYGILGAALLQILGNTSLDSALVYAKRNTNALNQLARKEWETETSPTPPKPMRHLQIV
jgi:hypothetical protein